MTADLYCAICPTVSYMNSNEEDHLSFNFEVCHNGNCEHEKVLSGNLNCTLLQFFSVMKFHSDE